MKKSRYLTCPCHKIYRVEAVDLKSSNYTLKITIFCENVEFGAILRKFDILSISAWLKFESKILLHICDTYNCDYLPHTTFRFYSIDFKLMQISLPNFAFFYRKIT